MSSKDTVSSISNSDVFLYCLYRLGGATKFVDIEDVFVEMWRLAPHRFGWRKYPYPNYKAAYVAISDASGSGEHQDELLIRSGDQLCRQLTAKGVRRVESRLKATEAALRIGNPTPADRRPAHRALLVLEAHPVVQAFLRGDRTVPDDRQMSTMLRCASDAPREVRVQRLRSLRAGAEVARRTGLAEFLDWLEAQRADWFGRP